jgi:hypothetical protein
VKNKHKNYLKTLHKLTLLSTSAEVDEFEISKLEKEIKSFTYGEITTNKKWLLERVSQLSVKS